MSLFKRYYPVLVAVLVAVLPLGMNTYWTEVAVNVGLYALLALSLNVILGQAGIFHMGHAAFYAVGAYTSALLALTPLAQLDYDALSEAISRLELEKEEAGTGIEIRNQELVARIISGRVQAYILDKAASLGLTVTVELEMETRAATPYPKAVTIHGEATPAQKQQLQQYLEQTFAIPVQRQVWTP